MLMSWVETALVTAPPRRWWQRFYETEVLLLIRMIRRRM